MSKSETMKNITRLKPIREPCFITLEQGNNNNSNLKIKRDE